MAGKRTGKANLRLSVISALTLLASVAGLMETGCLGQLPEITDGAAPHRQRGCFAQAWSMSEVIRVWKLLAK